MLNSVENVFEIINAVEHQAISSVEMPTSQLSPFHGDTQVFNTYLKISPWLSQFSP